MMALKRLHKTLRYNQEVFSDQMSTKNFSREFCMVLLKELWGGPRGDQQKMVLVNAGSRRPFITTVLVSGAEGALATQPGFDPFSS